MISFENAPKVEPHIEVLPASEFSEYLRQRMEDSGRPPLKVWSPSKIHRDNDPMPFEEARAIVLQKYDQTDPVAILTDIEAQTLEQATLAITKEPFDADYLAWKKEAEERNKYILEHLEDFD